ncbi:MAG: substrate-binding protein [Geminicoccaceae bacterium]|nr:substrate-binding protein [Geminicoccaceae bacterium]
MDRTRRLTVTLAVTALIALSRATGAQDFELAMVIKETTNPYYNATLAGALMAAEEIGGTAKNYGPTQSSAEAQIAIINNLADRRVPAIAVAPSDPNAVAPAMKRAQRIGSAVISFDADSAPDARPFFVNQATTDSVGRFGAVRLAEAMGNKGQIAIVSAQPTAANQNAWIAAFRDELSKPEHQDIEIVDEVYGQDNEQKAFDLTVALTTKYPELAGIYAPTCPGLPAVARALESVGKGKGQIKLAGIHLLRRQAARRRRDRRQARRYLHDRGRQQVAGHLRDSSERRDHHRRSAAIHRGQLQRARVLGDGMAARGAARVQRQPFARRGRCPRMARPSRSTNRAPSGRVA